MERLRIELPISDKMARNLRAGDLVSLSGDLFTARDAAHQKMLAAIEHKESLPIDLACQTIYYAGPCPARPGRPVGSVGPTTSGRMDFATPQLLDMGLRTMIGKGRRSAEVVEAMRRHGAVYLSATGGAGALLAQCVVEAEVVAYPELGTEAIRRLRVIDFPAVVIIDTQGNNLYEIGRNQYARTD